MGDLDYDERQLLKSIDKVKIMTVDDTFIDDTFIDDTGMNALINLQNEFYSSIARNPEMEKLLEVKSENDQVTIFGKGTEKAFDELFILVGGNDNAMVYIKGKIRAESLSGIIHNNQTTGLFSRMN